MSKEKIEYKELNTPIVTRMVNLMQIAFVDEEVRGKHDKIYVDGKEKITDQDLHLISLIISAGKPLILGIRIDGKNRLEELICDGVLLSTPAGSTAYNLSAHGPILPITSNLLALTPISAFRPRRWKGALIPHNSEVEINILENKKRPVSAVADNLEIRDVLSVKINEDRDTELFMLFDSETNLEEKIIEEQFTYS